MEISEKKSQLKCSCALKISFKPGKVHLHIKISLKSFISEKIFLKEKNVPRENKNNAYAKFWRTSKRYYGIVDSGLWQETV